MHKKFSRLIEPNLQPYFLCLALFILIAIPIQPVLALLEAAGLVLLYLFYRNQSRKRRRGVMQYIGLGLIYTLDKKSLAEMNKALGRDAE